MNANQVLIGVAVVGGLICGSFTGVGCNYPAVGNQHVRPDALIVLPGAFEVHDTDENEGTVLYQLNENYPAQQITQTITDRLESHGWRPLLRDFLNPTMPTSLIEGWDNFEDGTKGPPTEVYQWVGQWEDDSKRIVWYVFTYDGASGPLGAVRARGPLRVRATLLSAATVESLRDAVKNRPVPK